MKNEAAVIFEPYHQSCLNVIAQMVELHPAGGTPESRLLNGLAEAVEEYELAIYGADSGVL